MEKKYDYFYGAEADQFTFYRIPKELMQNPEFVKIIFRFKDIIWTFT